jgi:hypothetical protein
MCTFFGWVLGTDVVRRYVHVSGKDVDNTLLAMNEGGKVKRGRGIQTEPLKCIRCTEVISPGSNFCSRCALPINLNNVYTRESELKKENRALKQDMKHIREEMNQKFNQIILMIQQNPKLSQVKSEVLVKKRIGK